MAYTPTKLYGKNSQGQDQMILAGTEQDYKNYTSWGFTPNAPSAPAPAPVPVPAPVSAPAPTQQRSLIDIAQSRIDVLSTAKAQGGDPFTAGTKANTWLNNWWNTAGQKEYPPVVSTPVAAPLPTTASEIKTGDIAAPDLKTPIAGNITDQYTQSALVQLETARKTLETSYQKQIDTANSAAKAAQTKMDEFTAKEKTVIDLSDPTKRATYEQEQRIIQDQLNAAEAGSKTLQQNYEDNQKLTNELSTLLTDIQASLQREKDITGLAAIQEPRIAKMKEDAMARAGVIESVMAARNGQITVAENLIDRTANAIASDRTDKLNYYNTLLSFYDKQTGVEGTKLLALTAEQKTWVAAQVNLLQNDLATSQANVDYIKKMMTDPDTALAYAQSGVNLNDSSSQINLKLAAYGYTKEVANTSKDMAGKGYTYLMPGQTAPAGAETTTITDSKGVSKQWYKMVKSTEATTSDITEYEYAVKNNGYKGTLAQWQTQQANLKAKSDIDALSVSERKIKQEALSGYLGAVATYKTREEAITALDKYQAKIITDVGQDGYNLIKAELERQFPAPKAVVPSPPKTMAETGKAVGKTVKPVIEAFQPQNLYPAAGKVVGSIGSFFSSFFKGLFGM